MTDTVIEPTTDERVEAEYKKYTHIVRPPENGGIYGWLLANGNSDPKAADIVAAARDYGWELIALCGYKWVPQDNPDAHDACPICMDVAGMHMRNEGE